MADDEVCHICKVKLTEENKGEELTPFGLPDYDDYFTIHVCTTCEHLPEHTSLVEQTDINHRAEASYQEWCESQDSDDE